MNKVNHPVQQIERGLGIALMGALITLMAFATGCASSCSTLCDDLFGSKYYNNPFGIFGLKDYEGGYVNHDRGLNWFGDKRKDAYAYLANEAYSDGNSNVHDYSRRGHHDRDSAHHRHGAGRRGVGDKDGRR